jgi:hypothetical protein
MPRRSPQAYWTLARVHGGGPGTRLRVRRGPGCARVHVDPRVALAWDAAKASRTSPGRVDRYESLLRCCQVSSQASIPVTGSKLSSSMQASIALRIWMRPPVSASTIPESCGSWPTTSTGPRRAERSSKASTGLRPVASPSAISNDSDKAFDTGSAVCTARTSGLQMSDSMPRPNDAIPLATANAAWRPWLVSSRSSSRGATPASAWRRIYNSNFCSPPQAILDTRLSQLACGGKTTLPQRSHVHAPETLGVRSQVPARTPFNGRDKAACTELTAARRVVARAAAGITNVGSAMVACMH